VHAVRDGVLYPDGLRLVRRGLTHRDRLRRRVVTHVLRLGNLDELAQANLVSHLRRQWKLELPGDPALTAVVAEVLLVVSHITQSSACGWRRWSCSPRYRCRRSSCHLTG